MGESIWSQVVVTRPPGPLGWNTPASDEHEEGVMASAREYARENGAHTPAAMEHAITYLIAEVGQGPFDWATEVDVETAYTVFASGLLDEFGYTDIVTEGWSGPYVEIADECNYGFEVPDSWAAMCRHTGAAYHVSVDTKYEYSGHDTWHNGGADEEAKFYMSTPDGIVLTSGEWARIRERWPSTYTNGPEIVAAVNAILNPTIAALNIRNAYDQLVREAKAEAERIEAEGKAKVEGLLADGWNAWLKSQVEEV